VNDYQDYQGALANFNKAISLNPQGIYYLNRSVCYFRMGDMMKAKEDAQIARQKGVAIPENFRKALNL
jgi:tetratricopeptide (TPR) repeat protein